MIESRSTAWLIQLTGVFLSVSSTVAGYAAELPPTDNEVKAAYIYNFARFVQWPAESFQHSDGRFEIGVLGTTDLRIVLEQVLVGKSVADHEIVVRWFDTLDQVTPVHILYVSPQSSADMTELLTHTEGSNVLLVGDRARFARDGGTINFVLERRRVRFEVNMNGVRRSGLEASSRLLKLATAFYAEP